MFSDLLTIFIEADETEVLEYCLDQHRKLWMAYKERILNLWDVPSLKSFKKEYLDHFFVSSDEADKFLNLHCGCFLCFFRDYITYKTNPSFLNNNNLICSGCPLAFNHRCTPCYNEGAYHDLGVIASSNELFRKERIFEAALLAEKIANLPLKPWALEILKDSQ